MSILISNAFSRYLWTLDRQEQHDRVSRVDVETPTHEKIGFL